MEKNITLTVRSKTIVEQCPLHWPSNTVDYITATFDLDSEWEECDVVKAVWSGRRATIVTLLDANNTCTVPHEVLATVGKVNVNLTGIVYESGEEFTRITTYPFNAITIDAAARVDGDETAPVTPSQFDQFVEAVKSETEKVTGMTAVAETLPTGSDATASYSDGVLTLGIPRGDKGDTGETGAQGPKGDKGDKGEKGEKGIKGDKGDKGDTGATGAQGERGPQGIQGETGPQGPQGPHGDDYVLTEQDKHDIADIAEADLTPTILNAFPTDTASGAIASFPDGADDLPLKSLVVNINPVQDLHGQESPYPAGGGKNLLWLNNGIFKTGAFPNTTPREVTGVGTWVGITSSNYLAANSIVSYTIGDNSLTVKSSANGYGVGFECKVTAGQKYTLSWVGTNAYVGVAFYDSNGEYLSYVTSGASPKTFTVPESTANAIIVLRGGAANVTGEFSNVQLEEGQTATAYSPYSNICPISGWTGMQLNVNGTVIPISWQTEAGTVYGGRLDVLSGKLTVYPYYASYNGETLTGEWISDRDVYAVGTTPTIGAQVVNIGAEGTEIQLEPHEVASLLGTNNIFADTGDTACEYRADTKLYIERLTAPDSADMIADANITSGQYFMVGNSLYKATANIANGAQIIVGTNCIRKSLSEALNEINA